MSMRTSNVKQHLRLLLAEHANPFEIKNFDNASGQIDLTNHAYVNEGTILDSESRVLWRGLVALNENGTFNLCVRPSIGTDSPEVLNWKDLPPFFTVFDGGYESLETDGVGKLLDDLVTFHELVKVRCHFELKNKFHSVPGVWGAQENLKSLSEVLIDWKFVDKLETQQIVLLELELFETVFFVIGINEECDGTGIVLSLTTHFYQQKNRIGRRIPIEAIEIGQFRILEVSDFGLKVETGTEYFEESVKLTIGKVEVDYKVIFRKRVGGNWQLGLALNDFSAEARKAWQHFLLVQQYPLLKYRNPADHEDTWTLLEKSGYFSDAVGQVVRSAKPDVLNEWTFVDVNGPDVGISVIGRNDSAVVATIGVSRASQNTWVAQSAAVIDDPKNLKFTESMYSWRTRAILQQADGEYHLAFFDADKPFLDRFFRKFLLTRNSSEQSLISWNEWYAHYLLNSFVIKSTSETHDENSRPDNGEYFPKILQSENGEPLVAIKSFGFEIRARNHLHIAQLLSSIWNEKNEYDDYLSGGRTFFATGAKFILIMNKHGFDANLDNVDGAIKYLKKVVWTCKRDLLPAFLQNSLRALELMNRKYGPRRVA